MIEKKFDVDLEDGRALTLSQREVTEGEEESGEHERTHNSGWTIKGTIREDYYIWVNEFEATHPKFGRVHGDFEKTVFANSEEAFLHFYDNHTPEEWDYGDI